MSLCVDSVLGSGNPHSHNRCDWDSTLYVYRSTLWCSLLRLLGSGQPCTLIYSIFVYGVLELRRQAVLNEPQRGCVWPITPSRPALYRNGCCSSRTNPTHVRSSNTQEQRSRWKSVLLTTEQTNTHKHTHTHTHTHANTNTNTHTLSQ